MYRLKAHIETPGLFTTIQDEGRFEYLDIGIPVGGAMDIEGMLKANQLVKNLKGTPVLEFTLKGPTIRFEGSGMIALSGAPFIASINGKPIDFYENIMINNGDLLEIKEVLAAVAGT